MKQQKQKTVDIMKSEMSLDEQAKSLLQERKCVQIAHFMIKQEAFKDIKMCVQLRDNYYYIQEWGYYKRISQNFIEKKIFEWAQSYGVIFLQAEIVKIYKQFELYNGVEPKEVERDTNHICFSNGLYNLQENKLIPHTPDIFVTESLGYPYQEDCSTNRFQAYLQEFCENKPEKIHFVRSWMKLLISSFHQTQTFLYVVGPGGSGKSIFESICKALVGMDNCITTSCSAMNNDRFEAVNFKNKVLVTISDSEKLSGNLSVLKMLTGGD